MPLAHRLCPPFSPPCAGHPRTLHPNAFPPPQPSVRPPSCLSVPPHPALCPLLSVLCPAAFISHRFPRSIYFSTSHPPRAAVGLKGVFRGRCLPGRVLSRAFSRVPSVPSCRLSCQTEAANNPPLELPKGRGEGLQSPSAPRRPAQPRPGSRWLESVWMLMSCWGKRGFARLAKPGAAAFCRNLSPLRAGPRATGSLSQSPSLGRWSPVTQPGVEPVPRRAGTSQPSPA